MKTLLIVLALITLTGCAGSREFGARLQAAGNAMQPSQDRQIDRRLSSINSQNEMILMQLKRSENNRRWRSF